VKSLNMKSFGDLGGAARTQSMKKKIGGVTDGIRARLAHSRGNLESVGETGLLMTGEASKTMGGAWANSLGFLDVIVHGKAVQALVDTGATHNFMTPQLARTVGLTILPSNMEVKAVNSKAKVTGLAHEVPMQAGGWSGQLDFTVMEMNDFDMILGQDFLKGNKVIVVPFCDEVLIVGQNRTWALPTHRQRSRSRIQMT